MTIIALATLFGFGALVTAQQETGNETTEQKKASKITAVEIEKLIGRLGDETFAHREEAHKKLAELGEDARPWLKKARDSKDPEIRWRASRLLCALDEGKKAKAEDRPQRKGLILEGSDDEAAPDRRFFRFLDEDHEMFNEEISDHLNGLFGDLFEERFKPFQFRFFGNDLVNIDDLLEEFERETGKLSIQLQGSTTRYNFQKTENGTNVSFSLTLSEDGAVEARVKRVDEKGSEKEEVYSAKSLEEFKKNYPEVVEEFQLDGFQLSIQIPEVFKSPRRGLGLRLDRAPLGFSKKFHRKVLGVYTSETSPVLRAHLGLENGIGLVVTETSKGSLAERMGLQPMDVIVSINSKAAKSADDIRRAMTGVNDGQTVTVEIVRKGERKKVEGKYRSPDPK